MHRLQPVTLPMLVTICDSVTALDLPPPSFGLVPDSWTRPDGCMPEIELEIWAADTVALTDVELFAGHQNPLAFADITVTITAAVKAYLDTAGPSDSMDTVIEAKLGGRGGNAFTLAVVRDAASVVGGVLTKVGTDYTFTYKAGTTTAQFEAAITASADLAVKTPGTGATVLDSADHFTAQPLANGEDTIFNAAGHALLTGDGEVELSSSGTIPSGFTAPFYVIADDADHFRLADSLTDAMGGEGLAFTGNGTGTIKLVTNANTARVHWASHGLLGPAGDGSISLTNQRSYWTSRPHSPRAVAYALKASFGSAVDVSAAFYGRMER